MVGNLAERAAEAIGADPLLARVAAYYHDVGKLANPVGVHREPGRRRERPRRARPGDVAPRSSRRTSPTASTSPTGRSLPKPLIAFIPQHHGTALMSYFYAKAREQAAAPFGGLDTAEGRDGGRRAWTSGGSATPARSRSPARPRSSCSPTAWRRRSARSRQPATSRRSGRWSRRIIDERLGRRPVRRVRPHAARHRADPRGVRRPAPGDVPPADRLPAEQGRGARGAAARRGPARARSAAAQAASAAAPAGPSGACRPRAPDATL